MAIDASVIIASYNRKQILNRCLECLFNQDYVAEKYEIIVIDDGSTDETEKMVKEKNPPCKLVYVRNKQRMGQSKAKNRGILQAKGKIIIFLDSDVLAPPWFVNEHVSSHEKNPNLIVDGPAINIRKKEELLNPPFKSFSVKLLAFLDVGGATFITANTSCSQGNLIKAGGFDEEFGTGFGWQDRELGLRLKKMELKRVKNTTAYVLHYKPEEETGISLKTLRKKYKERGENAALYYKKHPSSRVRREAHFHYLLYNYFIEKFRWLKKHTSYSYLSFLWQKKDFRYHVFKKLYLIQAYCEGLKRGKKKYKT